VIVWKYRGTGTNFREEDEEQVLKLLLHLGVVTYSTVGGYSLITGGLDAGMCSICVLFYNNATYCG